MNAIAPVNQEEAEVYRPSAAIDPVRLGHLWALAEQMASSALVPDTLRGEKTEGSRTIVEYPMPKIVANVFAVVEQADRWNMSPFALMSCAAIVYGKLGFEGKVIAAVLESRFGVKLNYEWTGQGDGMSVSITGSDPRTGEILTNPITGEPLTMVGSVAEWKTTGAGSPWKPATYKKMLVYRGAREWARVFKPVAILGVLGDDEIYEIEMERRAGAARDISTSDASVGALTDRYTPRAGFSPDNVKQIGQSSQTTVDTAIKQAETVGVGATENQSDQKADEKKADPEQPVARMEQDVFSRYSSALARMSTDVNVGKAHVAFWDELKGKPTNKHDVELSTAIFNLHKRRAKGETSGEGLSDDIDAMITKSFEPRF